ncbi:hypothetical protein PLEOSDRAFT_165741 [Pleurotus ostreatus PC15]|uniref:Uncharacterized protein n=1 Tax=Pleurotus ostreatus (strain PC15) TaxID=1137138 RepID=A0A067NQ84_PLEO1|nr:hypothetical protein PLEOSDRAFT_165741 [Pleurotus ostreatus PC15]
MNIEVSSSSTDNLSTKGDDENDAQPTYDNEPTVQHRHRAGDVYGGGGPGSTMHAYVTCAQDNVAAPSRHRPNTFILEATSAAADGARAAFILFEAVSSCLSNKLPGVSKAMSLAFQALGKLLTLE